MFGLLALAWLYAKVYKKLLLKFYKSTQTSKTIFWNIFDWNRDKNRSIDYDQDYNIF